MKRVTLLSIGVLLALPYALLPWYRRWGTRPAEPRQPFPGDSIVTDPKAEFTLAVSVAAPRSQVWPWLVQMGQGRGGFYTYEWIENILGAHIHNTDAILDPLQDLKVGDWVWLTPNPYVYDVPGQYLVVEEMLAPEHLVFRQTLPNGSTGSWAFVLRPETDGSTRLIFRRRASELALIDRILEPGYFIMDRGMLLGIKKRAESAAADESKPMIEPTNGVASHLLLTPTTVRDSPWNPYAI